MREYDILLENLDFLGPHYKRTDILSAFEYGERIPPDVLFSISALDLIFDFLDRELEQKEKLLSIFVEYTAIGREISHAGLKDFWGIRNYGGGLFPGDFEEAYYYSYNWLHLRNRTIFYHPQFFTRPENIRALVTRHTDATLNLDINSIIEEIDSLAIPPIPYRPHLTHLPGTSFYFSVSTIRSQAATSEPAGDLMENHRVFHFLLHNLLLRRMLPQNFNSFLFSIPIVAAPVGWFSPDTQERETPFFNGVGGIFIYIIGEGDFSISEETERNITRRISYLMKDLLLNFIYRYATGNLEEALEYSKKSAMAAIMARNMSHNIGSHVFSELVATGGIEEPNLELHRRFFRYLQHRMDFIAQITTEFPYWSYSAWFHKEIMREFHGQFVFLDLLNISEGLRAYDWPEGGWNEAETRGKLIIRTATEREGEGIRWIVHELGGNGKIQEDDFQIAVPGGNVGYHALYVILEDVIRNAAKHEYPGRRSELRNEAAGRGIIVLVGNTEEYQLDEEIRKKLGIRVIDDNNITCDDLKDSLVLVSCECEKSVLAKLFSCVRNSLIFVCVNGENLIQRANEWKNKGLPEGHLLSQKDWDQLRCLLRLDGLDAFLDKLTAIPLRVNVKIEEGRSFRFLLPVEYEITSERSDNREERKIEIKKKKEFVIGKGKQKEEYWLIYPGEVENIKLEEVKVYDKEVKEIPIRKRILISRETFSQLKRKASREDKPISISPQDFKLLLQENERKVLEKLGVGKEDLIYITIWSDSPIKPQTFNLIVVPHVLKVKKKVENGESISVGLQEIEAENSWVISWKDTEEDVKKEVLENKKLAFEENRKTSDRNKEASEGIEEKTVLLIEDTEISGINVREYAKVNIKTDTCNRTYHNVLVVGIPKHGLEKIEKFGDRFPVLDLLGLLKELGVDVKNLIPVHSLMNFYLERSFIDKTGKLRKENWGLAEMKISAGYLQMRSVSEIGAEGNYFKREERMITPIHEIDPEKGFPKGIIKAVAVDEEGNEIPPENLSSSFFLGFKFWVKKPKEVMYVNGSKGGE